jgi:hypothetical protein
MRLMMFVLAIGIAFVAWDTFANHGRYLAQFSREMHRTTGLAGIGVGTIKPPDLSPTWKRIAP